MTEVPKPTDQGKTTAGAIISAADINDSPVELLRLVNNAMPILRATMPTFDFDKPPTDPVQLARDMAHTLLTVGGLGLSANQVGLPFRMFVVASNPIMAIFNPRIVDMSTEQVELEEGCLSWPGLFLKIKRSRGIKMRWTMPTGETLTERYEGITARVIQHEVDHLNGIVFLNKVSKLRRQMALDKQKNII